MPYRRKAKPAAEPRRSLVELSVPNRPLRVPATATGPGGLAGRGRRRHCPRPGQRREDPRQLPQPRPPGAEPPRHPPPPPPPGPPAARHHPPPPPHPPPPTTP